MSVISIKNLTRDYGNNKGIFDISFEVSEGEVFGFLGPNGAGKTTTIRHLLGLIKNKSGSCQILDKDCWSDSFSIQDKLGYIPGEISLFDDMSGLQYLDFVSKYRGLKDTNRRDELISMFELDTSVKIRKMSKGMKQKVGIVAAFMHNPEILILDEPTSGLDPLMQNRFVELIEQEKQNGKTILLSSHMFEEVERTCDRIGIIREGKMVAIDNVDTLRKRHMHTYLVTLSSDEEAKKFASDFNGKQEGNIVKVSSKQSLESIFMHYYGGENND